MSRYQERIKSTMALLLAGGYTATKFIPSKDIEQEDDTIEVADNVVVQVDSRSGDAVSVNRYYTDPKFVMYSWDVESNADLLPNVKKAIDHVR